MTERKQRLICGLSSTWKWLDQRYREFVKRHMIIGFFILFAVIPVFILFSVAVITMAIIFPLLSVS